MQSLSIYARLFARTISGTEAENILFHSLLRLSSTSVHITQSSNRHSITLPSSAIRRAVHLITVSSGYSSQQKNSSIEKRTNVYGDDALFITKHRLGDFRSREVSQNQREPNWSPLVHIIPLYLCV